MVDIRSCDICKALLTVEEQNKNAMRYGGRDYYFCKRCRDLVEMIVNMAVTECEKRFRSEKRGAVY